MEKKICMKSNKKNKTYKQRDDTVKRETAFRSFYMSKKDKKKDPS